MSASSEQRPWYARTSTLAILVVAAVAWAGYLIWMVIDDPDLSSLEEASGYEFRFDPWLLVVVAVIGMVIPAIVCFIKGKVGMGIVGLFVPVVSLVGAVKPPKPDSLWSQRFPRTAGGAPPRV